MSNSSGTPATDRDEIQEVMDDSHNWLVAHYPSSPDTILGFIPKADNE